MSMAAVHAPGHQPVTEAKVASQVHVADLAYVTNLVSEAAGGQALLPESATSAWVGQLDLGRPHASVALQVFQDPAIRAQIIDGLYEQLLGRAPSHAEGAAALSSLSRRRDLRQVIAGIGGGEEYFRRNGGTPSGLKAALARDLGGDAPAISRSSVTASSLSAGSAMPSGRVRAGLVAAAMSHGYVDPTLSAQYQGLTGLAPTSAALARLSRKLAAGGGLAKVLAGLAGTQTAISTLSASLPSGLSIKRVQDALQVAGLTSTATPYASIAYAAAPFQVTNADGRRIGPGGTDFWTMNLDPSDVVSIDAVDPLSRQDDPGVAIYVWQASATITDAAGLPAAGTTFSLVLGPVVGSATVQAPMTVATPTGLTPAGVPQEPGTGGVSLVIGFAQVGQPAPDPMTAARAQAPAGAMSAASFDASFRTYPGTQTDVYNVLTGYHAPGYTYDPAALNPSLAQVEDWPTFTPGQAAAYDVFATMARAGSIAAADSSGSAPQSTPLANFTDFRDVGSENSPATQSGYLNAVWAPISSLIQAASVGFTPSVVAGPSAYGEPSVIVNGVDYVYGYTVRQFENAVVTPIARGVSGAGSPSSADFLSVQSLISSANASRGRLQAFIDDYKSWSTTQSGFLGETATGVAGLLATGISDSSGTTPLMSKAVDKLATATNALNLVAGALSTVASAAAFVVTDGSSELAKGIVKGVATASSASWFASSLTQEFDVNSKAEAAAQAIENGYQDINANNLTSREILQAGEQIDQYNKGSFIDSCLDMQVLATSMFSNYGLLQALGGIAFPTADQAGLTNSDLAELNQATGQVEQAVAGSYQLSAYSSLLPAFFQWQNATDVTKETTLRTDLANLIPTTASFSNGGSWNYNYDQGLWYGLEGVPAAAAPSFVSGSTADPRTAIGRMLTLFQGGTPTLALGSGGPNWVEQATSLQNGHASPQDWKVPAPFAGSTTILTPDTYSGLSMGRFYASVPVNYQASGTIKDTGDAIDQGFTTTGSGYDAMEWGLFNPTTRQAISTNAVAQLFGSPDYSKATLADNNDQYYLGYETPRGGLANIADVFYGKAGWSVPGGGDASRYSARQVSGIDGSVPLGPSTASIVDYKYTITPTSLSPLRQGRDSTWTDLGTSLKAPGSGSTAIPSDSYLASPSGRFYVAFQGDGNIVLYDGWDGNLALWASGTVAPGGSREEFAFNSAGVLSATQVTSSSSRVVWSSSVPAFAVSGITLSVNDEGAAVTTAPSSSPMIVWTTQGNNVGELPDDAPSTNWVNLAPSLDLGDTLQSGQVLNTGQYLLSPGGQFALVLQANTQLIEYDLASRTMRPIWTKNIGADFAAQVVMGTNGNFTMSWGSGAVLFQTNTHTPGSILKIQDDGNVVVYSPGGQALWASNTQQQGELISPGGDYGPLLQNGLDLAPGQYLKSDSGQDVLVMQFDGDLDLYNLATWELNPLWSSGTSPNKAAYAGYFLGFQSNGLVVNYPSGALKSTLYSGSAPSDAYLTVTDNGTIEITDGTGKVYWEPYKGSGG